MEPDTATRHRKAVKKQKKLDVDNSSHGWLTGNGPVEGHSPDGQEVTHRLRKKVVKFVKGFQSQLLLPSHRPRWHRGRDRRPTLSHEHAPFSSTAIIECSQAGEGSDDVQRTYGGRMEWQPAAAVSNMGPATDSPHSTSDVFPELFQGCSVHVQVKAARRLVAADWNCSSDPYCIVRLGKREWRTKVVLQNVNPVWGETFTFTSSDLRDLAGDDLVVELEVWDWDEWNPDDFLGQAQINLSNFPLRRGWPTPALLTLHCLKEDGRSKKGDFGDVHVAMWLEEEQKGDSSCHTHPTGPLASVTSVCSPWGCTKQLPAVTHTAHGTVYEEPCVVVVKVTVQGLHHLDYLVEQRSSNEGASSALDMLLQNKLKKKWKKAPKWLDPFVRVKRKEGGLRLSSGLVNSTSDSQEAGPIIGGSYDSQEDALLQLSKRNLDGSNDEPEEEVVDELGALGHYDDEPYNQGTSGLPHSSQSIRVLDELLESESSFSHFDDTASGVPSMFESQDSSSIADWPGTTHVERYVYCKVSYAKQSHMTGMKPIVENGSVFFGQSFIFLDVRPLKEQTVKVEAWTTSSKTKRGRPLGHCNVGLGDLVYASAHVQSRPVEGGRPANRGTVWQDPVQMVELRLADNRGILQLHAGLADLDCRAQIYNTDVVTERLTSLPKLHEAADHMAMQPESPCSSLASQETSPPSAVQKAVQGRYAYVGTPYHLHSSHSAWAANSWQEVEPSDTSSTYSTSSPILGPAAGFNGSKSENSAFCRLKMSQSGRRLILRCPQTPRLPWTRTRPSPGVVVLALHHIDTFSSTLPVSVLLRCGPHWVQTKVHSPGSDSPWAEWTLRLPLYQPGSSLHVSIWAHPMGTVAAGVSLVKVAPSLLGHASIALSTLTPWRNHRREVCLTGSSSSPTSGSSPTPVATLHMSVGVHYHSLKSLLHSYLTPPFPVAFYELNLHQMDQHAIHKSHKQLLHRWLEGCNPGILPAMSRVMMASGRSQFSTIKLRSNISRLTEGLGSVTPIVDGFVEVSLWVRPMRSLLAVVGILWFCHQPSVLLPLVLLWWAWRLLVKVWAREENELVEDTNEFTESGGAERSGGGSAEAREKGRSQEDEVPLGTYNDLKRKYEQMRHRALVVQNIIDDVASALERVQALVCAKDPAATAMLAAVCVLGALVVYGLGLPRVLSLVGVWLIRPPHLRDPLPAGPLVVFGRLPCGGGSN